LDQASIVYRERGRRLFDSDAWADKGALGVRLDLGPDAPPLDVVTTHLLAGDDVPSLHRHVDGVLSLRRRRQVDELLAFVAGRRRDGDVRIVAGDFNIEASSPTGRWLVDRFAEAGFVDAWAEAGRGDGRTDPDGRIDYAFVAGATVESCVPVMDDRPADAPERQALATLSDHAALDVVLRLS
jgi:endonuclease/exonuclease/phosphatase family metal-dependent hydrolase